MTNVVKFPTARVVFYRWCPSDDPERAELNAAYDSVSNAIVALRRQQISILARLHHKLGVPRKNSERVLNRLRAQIPDGPGGAA